MESVYRFILRMREENPGIPYPFVDREYAGMVETSITIKGSSLASSNRKRLAYALVEKMSYALRGYDNESEILHFLSTNRVVFYLSELTERIRLFVTTNPFDSDAIYSLGYRWATESSHDQLVCIGMLILGNFENDIVKNVLRVLGYHNALTTFAIFASAPFYNRNAFLFDLLKNTTGFGVMAALIALEPIHTEQQEWIRKNALKDTALPVACAAVCFEKPDMAKYFRTLTIDSESFSDVSRLIAYALLNGAFDTIAYHKELIQNFIHVSPKFADRFIDYSAILALFLQLFKYEGKSIHFQGAFEQVDYTKAEVVSLYRIARSVIERPLWYKVVKDQLTTPTEETRLITAAFRYQPLTPPFSDFGAMLYRNPFDKDLLDFFEENPRWYVEGMCQYVLSFLSDAEMFSGATDAPDQSELYRIYEADRWPAALLRMQRSVGVYDEELCIKSLHARYIPARQEAIQNLQEHRLDWGEGVRGALSEAYPLEPVQELKTKIGRLLGIGSDRDGLTVRVIEPESEVTKVPVTGSKIIPFPQQEDETP